MTTEELGTDWSDSWRLIRRFADFFGGCKEAIGHQLAATAYPNRWSNRGDWIYQDYGLDDGGASIVVGLGNTDEHETIAVHTRTPIVWVGVLMDQHPEWSTIAPALADRRPLGWSEGNEWFGRPTMWCYLADALGDGPFEEQRDRLAAKVSEARTWIAAATPAEAQA